LGSKGAVVVAVKTTMAAVVVQGAIDPIHRTIRGHHL